MSVFLELGQRPDEPGPPINGPSAYPAEVFARLEADAKEIIARYPQRALGAVAAAASRPVRGRLPHPGGNRVLRGPTRPDRMPKSPRWRRSTRCTGAPRPASTWSGVCTNTLCAIMGGDAILEALQDHLGIHAGQTTDDGRVTLEHVECNAACDYAPVVMVNWEFFDNQTPSSARDLVDGLRAGEPPLPTRGAPLCTFKETARTLAGLPDSRAAGNAVGDATLAGLRIAQERA